MKARRHTKILELIKTSSIDTQEKLLQQLCQEGFDVTQATVSRDIKELHLVKTLSKDGKYKYTIGQDPMQEDMSSKFSALLSDSMVSIECVKNIVLIKCMTGMAPAVCASMDSINWEFVAGTLSGDNTIMIIAKSEEDANLFVSELKKIVG